MADYIIGDVQGCFDALTALLAKIKFSAQSDRIFFAGDLINRGDQSLDTLAFIYEHRDCMQTVLGNHDLHLLACLYGGAKPKGKDTLSEILAHPDSKLWGQWLLSQPLVISLPAHQAIIAHAGIPPFWNEAQALSYSKEVQQALKQDPKGLLRQLYGNQPDQWDEQLTGVDRLRCIINYLTRMRLLDPHDRLDYAFKRGLDELPDSLIPWFQHPNPQCKKTVYFGHWAALEGQTPQASHAVEALDTGCVWGGKLTAYCLDRHQRISV